MFVRIYIVLVFTAWAACASAVDVVAEPGASARCETFVARRELKVFKDPTLFLPNLSLILDDPKVGWYRLMQETPLLTSLRGEVSLMRLGQPRAFRNFGVIARFYELAEPRLRMVPGDGSEPDRAVQIIPVQICGEGNLGFVLEADLARASLAEVDPSGRVSGHLPPSTHPNPIPHWREREPTSLPGETK